MTATLTTEPPLTSPPLESAPDESVRSVERFRLLAIMLALTLAVFGQAAGNAAADTKIDLTIAPLRFLGRALHLWDPIGGAGQLQNQAYGYLFPIGPFYAFLHALGITPWEMQRAFEAAIVCAAFLGTYRLVRRMGVDSFWPAVGAGLVYGVSPRILGELTSISAELMPVAALPWVLLPLVTGAERGSPRRAAALSGVALLFAGGVNAAATLAILPIPALWLLTRSRGPRRRALMGWWTLAVGLSCLWWALPLLELGRYSPPFLDWIETSSITTTPTSLLGSLRGLDHWEAYLGPSVWPGAWILASAPAAIVATSAVAAGGLVGLARRAVPHRFFLWASLLLGLLLVTAGHAAEAGPVGADWMRGLLDGVLVPFRNVHKFDPVIRLPIAIGVGHLLLRPRIPRTVTLPRQLGRIRLPGRMLAAVAVAAIGAVAVAPVWTNQLVSSQRVTAEPSWWVHAADWLAAHSHGTRALVVPGTGSPEYLWGGTVDNAMQPVARSPWTVRDGVPLAQPGYVRLLDAIDALLAAGSDDPRLAPLLTRAGIGFVVVANDLSAVSSGTTPLVYVRATLDDSPGLHRSTGFGPPLGGSLAANVVTDGGGTVGRQAVEIYTVETGAARASLDPLAGAVAATGSSDALPQLLERGLGADQPVFFGTDADGVAGLTAVTTDGIRKREAAFAGVVAQSSTMTQNQAYRSARRVHDYLPSDAGALSAYAYSGITDVTASSSGTDGWAFTNRGDLNGPWSAMDGDAASAWQSTGTTAIGQWLQVDLASPVTTAAVSVDFAQPDDTTASLPTSVAVTTDEGTVIDEVLPFAGVQTIPVHSGSWKTLRVTVLATADPARATSVAITSLSIPGVDPVRSLEVPSNTAPRMLAFDAATGYRSPCLQLKVGTVCDQAYATSGQEDSGIDRSFALGGATPYVASATVRLRAGRSLDRLLDTGNSLAATASSVISADPRVRPGAAVDGDPATSWQSGLGDAHPVLTVQLSKPRLIGSLTIVSPHTGPVAAALAVTVVAGGEHWRGTLPPSGRVTFTQPTRARTIQIRIDTALVRTSTNSATAGSRILSAGIAEVKINGEATEPASTPVTLDCRAGVAVSADGTSVPLYVVASRSDVLAGRPVAAQACPSTPVELKAGTNRVLLAASSRIVPVSVTLTRPGFALGARAQTATMTIGEWGSTHRTVQVTSAAQSVLIVHENANAGWTASLGGHALRSVRVDGWEQGFVVPAGAHGTITMTYGPQRLFIGGLIAGALAIGGLLALAAVRPRREQTSTALRDRRVPRFVAAAAVVGIAGLLAGGTGLLAAAVMVVIAVLVGRAAATVLRWSAGLLLTLAGLFVARGGFVLIEQNEPTIQLMCVAAFSAGALAAVVEPRQERAP